MLAVVIALGVVVVAGIIAIVVRARCPHCHHRALIRHASGDSNYKRVRCVHCKAEFAVLDGGYVPIKGTVVPEEKAHE